MRCPLCGVDHDRVVESRANSSGTSIRRRRECLECGYRFTSYEQIEEKQLMVIKRDGRREPFDIKKLERGIQISMEKRPIPQPRVEALVHAIEDEVAIRQRGQREIETRLIGELVLRELYRLDKVAYIRFASVYKMFEDVESFREELNQIFENKIQQREEEHGS
ncbi:MAG TPA: transcriptional repressor NrdR [Sediminispirochaeta sp.]|nr:transcriptional repressor NrdR [Sediminispirochaeta sp.]